MEKVRFKDLSMPNKIAIVLAWIVGVTYTIYFIIAFVIGVIGAI